MSDRPTRELTTSGGHTLVIKTYLTAREMLPISDKPEMPNSEKTAAILNQAVVSLNGSTDTISDRLLDLPLNEYTEIVKEVTAIINPTKPEK